MNAFTFTITLIIAIMVCAVLAERWEEHLTVTKMASLGYSQQLVILDSYRTTTLWVHDGGNK